MHSSSQHHRDVHVCVCVCMWYLSHFLPLSLSILSYSLSLSLFFSLCLDSDKFVLLTYNTFQSSNRGGNVNVMQVLDVIESHAGARADACVYVCVNSPFILCFSFCRSASASLCPRDCVFARMHVCGCAYV